VEDTNEQQRLVRLYEQLRLKLLDLSKKNPMLNYRLGTRSKRHLQIIDGVLEDIYRKLVGEDAALKIAFLQPPDDIPPEERTEDFISALEHAKVSDIEYITKLDELERAERDDEFAFAAIERELRIKVRAQLGLPPRPGRNDVNRADHARSLGIDPSPDLQQERSESSPDDDSLRTLKYPDELESIMEKISSDARLAEQEMGVSTLFLAFGFLEWYEADDSDKRAYAPLLLLPINVESRKVRGKDIYYLSARESGGETNLSLQKLLEERYNRELPNFVAEEDEALASIEDYLDSTRTAVEGLKRWNIRRWLVLGHFAFGRFLMYIDLNPDNWQGHPTHHSLVNAILTGSEYKGDEPLRDPMSDDYHIDDPEVEKIAPLLIQDADASQHSALIDMMGEKNLVIQGPPGTGKSQTIANMIANAIYTGKRVLFLSEKQAALEVVKRRLDRAGLGDFCLELHSDKASPKSVIESLKARRDLGWGQPRRSPAGASDVTWFESRKAIRDYLDELHTEFPDGSTPYALIWKALRGRTQDADVVNAFQHVEFPTPLLGAAANISEVSGQIDIFADTASTFARNFGHPGQSPWAATPLGTIPPYEVRRLISTLIELQTIGTEVVRYVAQYAHLGVETTADIERLIEVDNAIGDAPEDGVVATIASLDPKELSTGLEVKRELLQVEAALSSKGDLSREDPDRLALAIDLARCGAPAALFDNTPKEAYAIADDTIVQLSSLMNMIEGCLPILRALGLERAFPSKGFDAAAISALIASEIAPRYRSWIRPTLDLNEIAFETAYSRWSDLTAGDYEWRQKLAAYGRTPWPAAAEIEAAALVLRKGPVARAFATLTGSRRAARNLTLRLGFHNGAPTAEELDQLARHINGLVEFESDQEIASLFEAAWQGVATPFEEIAGGIRSRGSISNRLSGLPEGDNIAIRMVNMTAQELGQLGEFAPAGRIFAEIGGELKNRLSEQPIETIISELRNDITALQRLLDADRERVLIGLGFSIQEIAAVAKLVSRRGLLARTLSTSSMIHAIEGLGHSISEIDKANEAIDWIHSVRRSGAPPSLNELLTSGAPSEARGILREAASKGAVLCQAYLGLVEKCTHEFGMTSIQALAPNKLVERLELLLAHKTELTDFIALRDQRQRLGVTGLSEMLSCADNLNLAPDRLPRLFETLVSERRADQARRQSPALCQNGSALEARRRAFAERDRIKIYGDRIAIRERLLERRPFHGSNNGFTENVDGNGALGKRIRKAEAFHSCPGFTDARQRIDSSIEAVSHDVPALTRKIPETQRGRV
jgi:Protein of unknown function (DUF4011)